MKKIFFFILSVFACNVAFAQTDISTLSGKTPDAIVKLYGSPVELDYGENYAADAALIYGSFYAFFGKSHSGNTDTWTLDSFCTNDTRFCCLSDVFPGGIKVGTQLSKLQNFDFVNSKYGKGNSKNAFSTIDISRRTFKKKGNYMVFAKNYRFYYFTIENGKVVEWAMTTKGDATGDPNTTQAPSMM